MKIYDDRNKARQIQCNYCYGEGHNKRNCPTMKAHWEANKHLDPKTMVADDLVGVDTTMFPKYYHCLLYTSPSPRDRTRSRMPSSA